MSEQPQEQDLRLASLQHLKEAFNKVVDLYIDQTEGTITNGKASQVLEALLIEGSMADTYALGMIANLVPELAGHIGTFLAIASILEADND